MPIKPPPGFEEAFAAPCPGCGVPVGEHDSLVQQGVHLTGWLADPERSADEILKYYVGGLSSLIYVMSQGVPMAGVFAMASQQLNLLMEVQTRRSKL